MSYRLSSQKFAEWRQTCQTQRGHHILRDRETDGHRLVDLKQYRPQRDCLDSAMRRFVVQGTSPPSSPGSMSTMQEESLQDRVWAAHQPLAARSQVSSVVSSSV